MREPSRPSLRHWWNYVLIGILAFGVIAWAAYGLDGRIVFGASVVWIATGKGLAPSIIHEHMGFLNRWIFHDYSKANQRYRQAVWTKKATPEAFGALASLAFSEGEYTEAAALLEEAVRRSPRDPYLRFMLSKALLRAGRVDDALQAATSGSRIAERTPVSDVILGDALKAKGDLGAATASYHEALAVEPELLDTRLNLADICLSQGDVKAAELHVAFVLSREPRNPDALFWAGKVAMSKGETKKASRYFQDSVSLRPVNDHSHLVPYNSVISSLAEVRRFHESTW